MKKRKGIIFFLTILVIGLFLGYFYPETTGKEILNYIQQENIETVVVEKTIEDSENDNSVIFYELTSDELSDFYDCLENTKFRNIYNSSFNINSKIRYYVSFVNVDGNTECVMKFYNDEVLLFDYVYGTHPAVHERYKIVSTTLGEFFEKVVQ